MTTTIQLSDEQQKIIQQFNAKLARLVSDAACPVTDQATLIASGSAKVALESYVKAVKSHFGDELNPLEERVKLIKNQIASLIAPAKSALDGLVERQRAWMAQEKERAEAETRRKQEEINRQQREKAEQDRRAAADEAKRKKQAAVAKIERDFLDGLFGKREYAKRLKEAGAEEEAAIQMAAAVAEEEKSKPAPTVRVAPSIPAVAGVKNQTYYFAEVTDKHALIAAFEDAIVQSERVDLQHLEAATARIDFLRRFISANDAEVGKFARDTKDPEKVMAQLPGVRAWSKG